MRIALLAYLHGYGGAEKQIIMLGNEMSERGHDVELITIGDDKLTYPLSKSVKYIYLPDRKTNILRIYTRYKDIKYILKEFKPDNTISFWYQSAYLTAMMNKNITGNVVYSERGDPGDKEYDSIIGIIRSLTLPRIDKFVFQSIGAQKYFNEKIQKRSTVIPNPLMIDVTRYSCSSKRRKVIITAGRLHPQKNHKLLIKAFAEIKDIFPDYTLEIYGDGYLKNELICLIESLGLINRVYINDACDDILYRLHDSTLFVLTSDYEGLPNILIEAMALGLPCISTDCRPGGAREIISDGINGTIVPVNDVDELKKSLIELLSSETKRYEYANEARKIVSKFDPKLNYDKWESFLLE